jgi:hypothetical protein
MSNYEQEEEEGPKTLSNMVDTFMKRLKSGEPDKIWQRRELAYRRGYLQGWADALDTIFDQLLEKGVSESDAYRAVARIQNEVIAPWRNSLDIPDHGFNLDDYLKPVKESE